MASEGNLVVGVPEILENLVPVIPNQINQAWGVKRQLKKLEKTLESIQDLITDAEKKQILDPAVRLWLRRLKEVAYDAEDVLDRLSSETIRRRQRDSQLKHKILDFVSKFLSPLVFRFKIRPIQEKLDEICKYQVRFALKAIRGTTQVDQIREQRYWLTASAVVDSSMIIGREDASSDILKMLINKTLPSMSPSSSSSHNYSFQEEKFSVVSIVGMGGLGKTSLAQLIYEDESIETHFEEKIWVCVCDNFDVYRILKEILESITGASCGDPSNVDVLARNVKEKLTGKKYLLVLDDLWNEDAGDWEKQKGVLVHGVEGSKLLVTTRSHRVASVVGGEVHNLQKLTDDVCWSIMQKKISFSLPEDMINIGRDTAENCDGLPLAANFLGSLLHLKREERDWISINGNENFWFQPENKRVTSILELSYDNLPSPLKQCFSYCCLFPKDWEIEREMLIRMWMAEGFLHAVNEISDRSLEDIGNDYFEYLFQNSFFQDIKQDEHGVILSCKMHDLVHDLAMSVADYYNMRTFFGIQRLRKQQTTKGFSNKHLRVLELRNCGVEMLPDISKLIHLRYLDLSECQDVFLGQSISSLWCLQTLVLRGCGSLTELRDLSSLKNLRYLDISRTKITVLDSDVGALEQLEYLDVSETNIREIPNSIKDLCRLKTFKFYGCRLLEVLPAEFSNLIQLKCLDFSGTRIKELHESIFRCLSKLETLKLGHCKLPDDIGGLENLRHLIYEGDKFETPRGIRGLHLLQTLEQFVVRADSESIGGGIGDLEGLTLLEGKIKIWKLENVRVMKDAERANLKGKRYLRCLELHWSSRSNVKCSPKNNKVLNALQPHPDLEVLKITNFMGSKLPQWMGDSLSSYLPKLEELALTECNRWKQLPAVGQLPNLKVLSIHGMGSVKCLGKEVYAGECSTSRNAQTRPFPTLVELTLDKMENLESCTAPQSTLPPFPHLEKLTVRFCNKLQRLQTPFLSLQELKLEHCEILEDLPHIKCLKSLQRFTVQDCKKLKLSADVLEHVFPTALLDIDTPINPFKRLEI